MKRKEKLIKEIKDYVFSLYEIVDIFYNLGSYDNAEFYGKEIEQLENLIKKLEKECK